MLISASFAMLVKEALWISPKDYIAKLKFCKMIEHKKLRHMVTADMSIPCAHKQFYESLIVQHLYLFWKPFLRLKKYHSRTCTDNTVLTADIEVELHRRLVETTDDCKLWWTVRVSWFSFVSNWKLVDRPTQLTTYNIQQMSAFGL